MTKTKITALFLALIMALGCFGILSVSAEENEGSTFTRDDIFLTKSAFSKLPSTYEATVKFPKGTTASTRGGVIFGDFKNMTTACVSFEIHKNGNPRLYFIDANQTAHSYIFDKVNVYTGEWVNIAIVKDSSAKTVTCYINGEAKQTINQASPATLTLNSEMCIGGDHRAENEQFFKGSIKNVTVYSDIRTPDEIKADASGSYDQDNLIGSYDITANAKTIKDKNGKGPDFFSRNPWIEKEPVTDYAFSFAVVGDTQTLAYYYQTQFAQLYNWIVNNIESKKIEYVIGLGDITDKDTKAEWTLAKNLIKKLSGKVPFSLVRGNHDSVDMMNRFFPYSEYGSTVSGSYDNTMLNTYHKFTVGDIKYMLVNLDMGPNNDVLEWANKIVAENPDHNVIVTTHVYLYHDGTTLDENDNAPATKCGGYNDGDDIWNKFVKKHKNIVLVLSGHDPYDKIVTKQSKGENGNLVTQMLIDPQHTDKTYGGAGLVAMLYFSEDGSHIDVEYISTVNNAYFLEENQFGIDIAVVDASATPETDPIESTPVESTPSESDSESTEPTESNKTDDEKSDKDESSGAIITICIIAGIVVVIAIVAAIVLKKKKK